MIVVILIGLALLGFLCFIGNMLPYAGKTLAFLIKYTVCPLGIVLALIYLCMNAL